MAYFWLNLGNRVTFNFHLIRKILSVCTTVEGIWRPHIKAAIDAKCPKSLGGVYKGQERGRGRGPAISEPLK